MKTLQPSSDNCYPRCRDCGKTMRFTAGPDDTSGVLEVVWACESCGYVAPQLPWSHAEIRRRIAAVNARHGGVEVPMVYDPSPFPEEEW